MKNAHYFVMNRLNARDSFYLNHTKLELGEGVRKFNAKEQEWKLFVIEYNSAIEPLRDIFAATFEANANDLFHLLSLVQ